MGDGVADASRLGRMGDAAGEAGVGARVGEGVRLDAMIGAPPSALIVHPFNSGATHITTTARMARHESSPLFGGPTGMFVAPSDQVDRLLSEATSRSELELALGLEPDALKYGQIVRIDIADPFERGLRLPDPSSGNIFHRPGAGRTIGNMDEAVLDSPSKKPDPGVRVSTVPGF
jgi:hypothetical protein